MGDFNGDLGNSLGEKSAREPNQRHLKLLELADYFNLCPINLLRLCDGPTDTFISHCGRYRSTLDYIFVPNCLINEIYSAKTFNLNVGNTSDHLPIMIKLNQSKILDCVKILNDKYLTGSRSKTKILWSKFSSEKIYEKYVTPMLADLSEFEMCDFLDSKAAADKISQLLIDNSLSLVPSVLSRNKKYSKGLRYVKLPGNVKAARSVCKTSFDSWKKHDFASGGDAHDAYRCTRKKYRLLLRDFLNNLESDKVKKLCNVAESDEELFWKPLKGQWSTSQMSAFLVENKLITDKNLIREMRADHFEALGTPSVNENFDSNFLTCVTASVADIFKSCAEDPSGALCAPLGYEEVARVCSRSKSGTSGILIDYEHIYHAGPLSGCIYFY